VAAANYGSGSVALFPVRPDGALGEASWVARHEGSGPHGDRQEGPHAHSSVFTPDGRHLLVADLGIDRMVVYELDGGSLSRRGEMASAPGAGPRHMVFHPDGRHLFVVNELDSTLAVYAWEAGSLRHLQTTTTLFSDAPGNLAAELRVAAGGDRVYVSNRGHDSIAVFSFDGVSGLAPVAIRPCGGSWPRSFALTPDGRNLVVAARRSDRIVLLPLQGAPAGPGAPVAALGLPQPSSVSFV
jgi:6-phosphogluconolactonase